jgi:hypothetical protein
MVTQSSPLIPSVESSNSRPENSTTSSWPSVA